MARTLFACASLAIAIVSITSIVMLGGHLSDDVGNSMQIESAMAQSTTLAQDQEMQLRFPPGQYFYHSKSQIDGITEGFVDRLPSFNMTTDNAVNRAIIPTFGGWVNQEVTQHFTDPSLAFRYITLMLNAGYDATAPYHETAVGVYSRINNLATADSEPDIKGMNIASFHAAYQLMMKFDPDRKAQWDKLLANNNLNSSDTRGLDLDCWAAEPHNITNPVIIGNFAGKCVWEGRVNDGFNHAGDETNGYPFMDTTGYAPVNSANVLVDPSRWQPQIVRMGEGEYVGQQFITPQWANTKPYADFNPRDMRAPTPTNSSHTNIEEYTAQANEVMNAVAGLDDREKIISEYFDNKARGTLFFPAVKAISTDTGKFKNTMEFWQLDFMLHIAEFDAGIVAWQEKARYDTVRPITAIKYIHGESMVPTYDDKNNPNTPDMIPASQWRSYVNTGNHPEYPSATTCFCAAEAQAWRNLLGSDTIPNVTINGIDRPGFAGALIAKSSIHERGMTPAEDVRVSYGTWTEFVDECGDSRVYSGVHFRSAVDAAVDLCTPLGDIGYDYFQSLLNGTAPPRGGPDMPISGDPLMQTGFN